MTTDGREAYLETEILQADGYRLIILMYDAAIRAVARAREHLRRGEIPERSRQITRASEILNELAMALDHTAGGELSRNLAELYAYVQSLLNEGNFQQTEQSLRQAQELLATLLEGWRSSESGTCRLSVPLPSWELSENRTPVDCVG